MQPPQPQPPPTPPPAPARPPQWVALRRVARVSRADPGPPQGSSDFRLALDAPPRLARLAVSPPGSTTGRDATDRPHVVLAADPSGVLLLSGSHGPLAADEPGAGAGASYFLFDAVSSTVRRLPDVPDRPVDGAGTAGLIVAPGAGFMVAEMVPSTARDGSATLHCFSPESGVWINKILRFPDRIRLPWYTAHVVSYSGKLWWVDLSQGLLACDPFAGEPELYFVPLPASVRLVKGDKQRDVSRHRCLSLSAGKLRFVVITAHACVPKIKLWTLANPEDGEWTLDHEARVEGIWDDLSFKNTGLPKKRPGLALIHPYNPGVVYLFLQEHLFGVDLRTKMVTECASNDHARDGAATSSSLVLAWELPPSLTTSSSGPPQGEEALSTSSFDRIADTASQQKLTWGLASLFADMEFEQLTKIALGYLNYKTKKEENKFKEL
ncbi:hypothetical protein ACP70R_015616 [Stipagrostis hirtigluma subsp. patula]